ncbi:PTS system, cellobiose-specific IIB component [Clostridium cavendishii DSM 21758]|uniref:PTS system, cellobiose-specific IIB component n=1 Tax=Clostridium cavendishii DSM 21758 TaxID=1121302 RepID=A0A1M6LMZ0_9CLOT|nr:hypothetical protein [Clostridium cavendishii]SHJ72588.1 PTS system, cellobiose-specific IIB component [Clostridium cavendishii DSM 21758]
MKKILMICRKTGQATMFQKAAVEYVNVNNVAIEWLFADENQYNQTVEENNVDYVLLSPEMVLFESKIKESLTSKGIEFFNVKPADFGLRRIENILKVLKPVLEK